MYPRLGDFVYGLFGIKAQIPIQTFGFFVALAFVAAFFLIRAELRRRERLGHYKAIPYTLVSSGPMPLVELIFPTLIWTFVAWKVGYAFVDYDFFYQHTQQVILSGKGWWLSALAAFLGYGIPRWMAWKKSQTSAVAQTQTTVGPSYFMNLVLTMAFFAGILGAKVATYVEEPRAFLAHPWQAIFSFDGLAWYGGLLLAAFVICFFFWKKGQHPLNIIDGFAPGLILGYAIGRMGCHFSGDGDWGIPNTSEKPGWLSWLPDWAWAYDYPHNVVREGVPIPGCEGDFCTHLSPAVWPTPLYEIGLSLLIFGGLLLLRNKMQRPGQLTALYMILIGIERLLVESIRHNEEYRLFNLFQFTQAEIISVLLIGGGAFLLWRLSRRKPTWPGEVPQTQ